MESRLLKTDHFLIACQFADQTVAAIAQISV
jgi:hypothetical protein